MVRWNIEATFEELRAHLGAETRKQWSKRAIERTTPFLFGLFSLITLMAVGHALGVISQNQLPVARSAWYRKQQATFSDVIAFVRREIWAGRYSVAQLSQSQSIELLPDIIDTCSAVCRRLPDRPKSRARGMVELPTVIDNGDQRLTCHLQTALVQLMSHAGLTDSRTPGPSSWWNLKAASTTRDATHSTWEEAGSLYFMSTPQRVWVPSCLNSYTGAGPPPQLK